MISYIFLKLCLDICETSVEVKLEFYHPLNIGLKLVTLCLIESPNKSEGSTTSSIGLSARGGATLCIGGAMAPPNFF